MLPDIDLTLTTERLVELFAAVDDWAVDLMGTYLDTPSSKREEFKMNYQNRAQRKEAYLDYYIHNHPLASWTKIAKLLHVCGRPQQAAVVENIYIQGMLYAFTSGFQFWSSLLTCPAIHSIPYSGKFSREKTFADR